MNLEAGFGSLCAIVEREIDLQDRFLILVERQQALLTAGETQGLNDVADEQWQLLKRASALDHRLAMAVERLAAEHGAPGADATLTGVVSLAPEPTQTRLRDLTARLSESANRVQRATRVNAMLADSALGLIDFSLHAIAGAGAGRVTYAPPGQGAERGGGTLLLNARV